MCAVLLVCFLAFGVQAQAFSDYFAKNSTGHWGYMGPTMLTTGSPVMELPEQCRFGALLSNGKNGLQMVMSNKPCQNQAHKHCCSNGFCSLLATCHMGGVPLYKYGTFEASIKFAHYKNGTKAKNALSYFSAGYWDSPIHNEITLGFDGHDTTNKVHLAYWYNAQMRRHEKPVKFDPFATFNTYTIQWTPTSITWKANGETLHVDHGISGKTIPWEPLSTRIILRPHRDTKDDYVFIEYQYYKYTPLTTNWD